MAQQFLQIRNWAKFQHYKHRNPPWFKVHGSELMTSIDWVGTSDASRVLMVALWTLAAKTGNKIPLDKDYIKRVCYINGEVDFTQLLALQFIEIIDESGKVLAVEDSLRTNALPELETEKRQSTETEKKNTTPVALAVLSSDEGLEVVKRVFEYYCRKFDRKSSYTLTPKRKRQGLARFLDCMALARGQPSEAALLMKRAVDAMAASKWHRDNGHIEWELVFRSTEKLQEWLNKPQVKANGKAEQRASEIDDAGRKAEILLGLRKDGDEVLPSDPRRAAVGDGRKGVLSREPHPRILDGGIRVVSGPERQPVSTQAGSVDRPNQEPESGG